jgi:ATP-dependent DNA helicase RecG
MNMPVSRMKGIGPKRAQAMARLGIVTRGDLVRYAPADYRDMRMQTPIARLRYGQTAVFTAKVVGTARVSRMPGRRINVLRFRLADETGEIDAIYFNQAYLKNTLKPDTVWRFCGRVGKYNALCVVCPEFDTPALEDSATLTPVYRLTSGISQKMMRSFITDALEQIERPEETLDDILLHDYKLMPLEQALYRLHFPRDEREMREAVRRLSFEELMNFQLAMAMRRQQRITAKTGQGIATNWDAVDRLIDSLPYELTRAQKLTASEVLDDMANSVPMNRLIQGDVGSGKTVVAAIAMFSAALAKRQAIFMVPTEILARQHYETLRNMYEPFGVKVGLLTGSTPKSQRREAVRAIAAGEWQVIVGTHALFGRDVIYHRLSLVVTDEQHRFGVAQRTMAAAKGEMPHTLVMSATPIPRSLALVLYADLDISIINELPAGRKPVKTRIVSGYKRSDMYGFVREQIRQGNKCYVVCPLVDESEQIRARSAQETYDELCQRMPKGTVVLLHGRMSAKRKEEAIEAFAHGDAHVLVSTTVVEVGMDVPDATIMVVENAERFGLAQLHQLRGRVGRNDKEAWCFLVSEEDDRAAMERLHVLINSNDGFEIASRDLALRGPGQILGTCQHGTMDDGITRLIQDVELVKQTHDAVQSLMLREDVAAHRIISHALAMFDAKSQRIVMN